MQRNSPSRYRSGRREQCAKDNRRGTESYACGTKHVNNGKGAHRVRIVAKFERCASTNLIHAFISFSTQTIYFVSLTCANDRGGR